MNDAATAYVTQANLVDRFGESELVQLTDTVNRPASTIDAAKVTAAIRDASALIDSYIVARTPLPLNTIPPVLTRVAGDIARYDLHGSRADGDHPVTMRYRDALSWLKDVAKGTVQLETSDASASGGPDGDPEPSQGGAKHEGPRVFTDESLRGF